uniref:Uncharacterized protein n=1 Tax=Chlorobium chlorochromatii (strain CaD3) TaxID=340177 RepID=Q3ATN5_CHLCH
MSWGVEDPQKRKDIRELMDIASKIVQENPNHVNEVKKSHNNCWMEQIYLIQRCDFCDLAPDCPTREEKEWQEYIKANNIMVIKDSFPTNPQ